MVARRGGSCSEGPLVDKSGRLGLLPIRLGICTGSRDSAFIFWRVHMRKLLLLNIVIPVLNGCIGARSAAGVFGNGKGMFTDVKGINLIGEEIALPAGFDGKNNLVLVAFKRM